MATMGRYCKAYPIQKFRGFGEWTENLENLSAERKDVTPRHDQMRFGLSDDDYLFLQENFVVTDGIFLDENIIFDSVTPGWKQFCREILKFELPEHLSKEDMSDNP
jgi:hypothetical protein